MVQLMGSRGSRAGTGHRCPWAGTRAQADTEGAGCHKPPTGCGEDQAGWQQSPWGQPCPWRASARGHRHWPGLAEAAVTSDRGWRRQRGGPNSPSSGSRVALHRNPSLALTAPNEPSWPAEPSPCAVPVCQAGLSHVLPRAPTVPTGPQAHR